MTPLARFLVAFCLMALSVFIANVTGQMGNPSGLPVVLAGLLGLAALGVMEAMR